MAARSPSKWISSWLATAATLTEAGEAVDLDPGRLYPACGGQSRPRRATGDPPLPPSAAGLPQARDPGDQPAQNPAPPKCQAEIGPYTPDFLWPAQSLIVETDGRATHGTRQAFEGDRARSAELTIMGYRVLRFTWRQLTEQPGWVAQTVLAALGV